MSEEKKLNLDRRSFIGTIAIAGAGAVMASCAKTYPKLTFLDAAPDGQPLKAGLVGCGDRGTEAAMNFLSAGPNLKVVALADVFQDRIDLARQTLAKEAQQEIADDHCFLGFDAYKKLIESDVDVMINATPPHFRSIHFDYAVDAKKHCFIEKPVAVDAPGIRMVLAAGEKAKQYNLCVVAGTQRRHQREYLETYNRVSRGAIGRIVAARCRWNQSQLWYAPKKKGWSDMEAMIRDWVNWCWLSGDHIVEQHVHNLDAIAWFTGRYPTKVVGAGGRARRVTGDQFDYFSLQYTFGEDLPVASMCRQIDGCKNDVSELVVGTDGYSNCRNTIWDKEGKIVWQYQEPEMEVGKSKMNPYKQEHIDLVAAIRSGKTINEAEHVAKSTLIAIMGRTAAYTGQEVTWDEMMDSKDRLGPTEYAMGPVDIKAVVPVPGTGENAEKNIRA
jgi:myo-inositol 2-dehydrogenase/D-chiro-inositol 1-dehydrogenase